MFEQKTEIMRIQTIAAMVDSYQAARGDVAEAFRLLQNAKKRMRSAFGEYSDSVLPSRCSDYDLPGTSLQALGMIQRQAWRGIITKSRIKSLISNARKMELDNQVERGELPELTMGAVTSTLEDLMGRIPDLMKETVKEAFEFLRPPSSGFKTNTEFELGKRVIWDWAIDTDYSVYLGHHTADKLRSVDNAFHLLDGKGPVKYPADAETKIKEAIRDKKWEAETEYFEFKWYKKGTLHICLLRPDLVKKMNAMAGGNNLKTEKAPGEETTES